MKHLKPFNENNTEKLEAQDLLDFSQDFSRCWIYS